MIYKRFTYLIFLSFSVLNAYSQSTVRQQYVATYAQIAVDEMNRSGIPASITLAQGILESGDGQSDLARKSKNHFGIKCHKDWTGERVYHDDDEKDECFRKYKNVRFSFEDHTDFLVRGSRYDFLFDLDLSDYKGWAKGLKKAGYATSPSYAD
ncbi:MAG TPA: N-acetylmuramoyl-L-alanine amidase, partial [Cryomorphaceae bacterium]|nr:N-acetylmuramoyl-L-alanine amidase [Cryomorphaceae bacterium]